MAIYLDSNELPGAVYTPKCPLELWWMAKTAFQSLNCSFHQSVTHFLKTHACIEPFAIAAHRTLSVMHPVPPDPASPLTLLILNFETLGKCILLNFKILGEFVVMSG